VREAIMLYLVKGWPFGGLDEHKQEADERSTLLLPMCYDGRLSDSFIEIA
jgi:hypothetical protein